MCGRIIAVRELTSHWGGVREGKPELRVKSAKYRQTLWRRRENGT